MAEPTLCLSWNDHASELSRMWKTLLENNSFVDCTIAAEGKSVQAHRLILSACSPYFQMLFTDVNEKHPIVILRDTSFHMLKTLIDFVYSGKIEISTSQLETFLELAVSLQLKGLNNYRHRDSTINNLGNPSSREIHQCSSMVNRDNSRVENSRTSHEESFSDCSPQCHFQFSQDNSNSTQTVPPAQFEGSHDFAEGVQSRVAMMPVQNQPSHPVLCNSNVVVKTEQNLNEKHVFSEIKILDIRSEVLDSVNHVESMSGNPEGEINHESAPYEEKLDQYASAEGSPPPQDEDQEQAMPVRPGGQRPANSAGTAPSAPELQAHVRLFRMRTLKCRDCDAIFASSWDLEDHKRQHSGTQSFRRGVRGASPTASSDLAPHQRQLPAERQYSCYVCGKAFTTAVAVALHKRWHKRERRRAQPRGVSGKAFVKAATRALHKRSHSRERPHSCNVCGKHFTISRSLIVHKRIHAGERQYECDVCGKVFSQSGSLLTHKRTHSKECPYSCNVCGKAFKQSNELIVHKRMHTGERPFSCDVCGKAFRLRSNLVVHKRTHTGERPYSCDVCGKAFKQSSELSAHKRTHTGERPYSCDVCGKAFSQSGNLMKHKRTHSNERPYSCDVCGKTFKQSHHLKGHKRLHTGERPFSCDVCGKAFTLRNSLVVHKRTHTGESLY